MGLAWPLMLQLCGVTQRFGARTVLDDLSVDVPPGEPSKWLTFYGTRVLAWWDGATRAWSAGVTG